MFVTARDLRMFSFDISLMGSLIALRLGRLRLSRDSSTGVWPPRATKTSFSSRTDICD